MINITRGWLCVVVIMLAGCGFHLRGVVARDMPSWLDSVTIILHNNANADLPRRISEQLRSYYVHVTPDMAHANYQLIIERDEYQTNIASVSSTTTPRQYQLIYTLWFHLVERSGKEVIPLNNIQVSRVVTINDDRILGSAQEERLTQGAMRQDAVIQMINRIKQ